MFYDTSLETIYVSDLWDLSNVTDDSNMIYASRLVSQTTGMTFSSQWTDKTYCNCVDGYFTYKEHN